MKKYNPIDFQEIALVSVPKMLLPLPVIEYQTKKKCCKKYKKGKKHCKKCPKLN